MRATLWQAGISVAHPGNAARGAVRQRGHYEQRTHLAKGGHKVVERKIQADSLRC